MLLGADLYTRLLLSKQESNRSCVSKVHAFKIDGLYVYFRSSDHTPPHFHVKKAGHWEIRVFILTCHKKKLDFNVKWSKKGKPTAAEKRKILEQVLVGRQKLLEEWEEKVCVREETNE